MPVEGSIFVYLNMFLVPVKWVLILVPVKFFLFLVPLKLKITTFDYMTLIKYLCVEQKVNITST